jgi:hypothetical protein
MTIKLYRMLMAALLLFSLLLISTNAQSPSPTPFVIQAQSPAKDFMDYLLAGVQIATLIGLGLYVYKTWEIASSNRRSAELFEDSIELSQKSIGLSQEVLAEMKASRIQDIAPNVITYIDRPYSNKFVMYFVVKNTGKTVAKDVQFKFDPPLKTSFTSTGKGSQDFDISLIREGIKSLAPGQEIRTVFDEVDSHFKENLSTSYTVEVSYNDGLRTERITVTQVIDLSMFRGLRVLKEKRNEDLIVAVEELADSNKRVQRYLDQITHVLSKGIWVKNPEFFALGSEITPKTWKISSLSKLNEFKLLWNSIYAGNFERRGRFYIEDLQSRLSIIGWQLLSIASITPSDIQNDIKAAILELATKLNELSEMRFNVSRESFTPFNTLGTELVSLTDEVIIKLHGDASTHIAGIDSHLDHELDANET